MPKASTNMANVFLQTSCQKVWQYCVVIAVILLSSFGSSRLAAQSSTCVPGSVDNGNTDPWSEECYLNASCSEQGNPCQANDIRLVGVFIADTNGDPIQACNIGEMQNVTLWGNFANNTGTNRYAVRARTELFINGSFAQELLQCAFDLLPSGTDSFALLGSFSYTCGDQIQLLNTWVGWETSAAQCLDPLAAGYAFDCGDYSPAKCSKNLNFIDFLTPNFTYSCGEATPTTTEVCFLDLTFGGIGPIVSYDWDFGDGNSSSEQNPCHTYNATTGTFTVTLTVIDSAGNSAGVFLDLDLEALDCCMFSIDCPPVDGGIFACIGDIPPPDNDLIGINTPCGAITIDVEESSTGTGCDPDTIFFTRLYIVTDGMTTDTCTQIFRVVDDVPPSLTCPGNVTVQCNINPIPANTGGNATAMDNCGLPVDVTFSDMTVQSPSCLQEYVITRTWLATDACGNTNTCTQTITVDDSAPPSITCPANVTLACGADTTPGGLNGTATATDNCTATPTVSSVDSIASVCTHGFVIYRTWIAIDACGNSSSCVQTLTSSDTESPTITCPDDVEIECDESTLPDDLGIAVAVDGCDPDVEISYIDYFETPVSGDGMQWLYFPPGAASGSCVSQSNCETSTICFALRYTPDTTGILTSYTTGFFIDCYNGGNPVVYNESCVMTDNSGELTDCGGTDLILMNCSGNTGLLPVFADVPVLIHQVCFTLGAGASITLDEDEPTDLTTSIDLPEGEATETPSFTNYVVDFDAFCGEGCVYPSTINRQFIAVDDCGNVATCVQQITIDDNTPPVLTCPDPAPTVECPMPVIAFGDATAVDNCDPAPVVTFDDVTVQSTVCAAEYTITRTWTATDVCGNTSTCSRTISVVDDTPPTLICPDPVASIECPATPVFGDATATDACDGMVEVTFEDVTLAGGCPQEYTITRTWTATDDCGNTATCSRTISVTDNTPPTITCPDPVATVECPGTPDFGDATATDICDPDVAVTFMDVTMAGSCTQEYTITRTWTATDDCGNTATCSRTISITDNTAPVLTCPANTTIECDESTLAADTGIATASDACDPTVDITSIDYYNIPPSGDGMQWLYFPPGASSGTCVSNSDCSTNTLCFVLRYTPDTTGILTSYTTGFFVDCFNGNNPVNYNESCVMTDNSGELEDCGGSGILLMNSSGNTGLVPVVTGVPVILHQVCFTLDAGATITLDEDETTDLTTSIDLPMGEITESPSFTNYVVDFDALCGEGCLYPATIYRQFVAVDDCGNVSDCVQEIVIDDTTAPVLTCPDPDPTIECPEVPVFGTATASDNCDAAPVVTFDDITTQSTVCAQEYSVTRTWTATDVCGNTSTCSRTITVEDNTPPTITCPDPAPTVECPNLPVFGDATATDACDGLVEVTFDDVTIAGTCAQEYTITRTWTATDDCGNTATCSRTISVEDNIPPTIICPDPAPTVECPNLPVFGDATATDACDGLVEVTFDDVTIAGTCAQEYTITRTWTATDDCGNTATCSRTISVEDNTPPTITCPDPAPTVECPNVPVFGDATATDACDALVEVTFDDVTIAGACAQEYTITRTWTATDDCGNTATCSRTISVEDNTPPTITCPDPAPTVECPNVPVFGDATATDACDLDVVVTFSDVTVAGECPQEYSITRTWTATDDCGNTSTCSRTISVTDTTAPEVTCPADVTVQCDESTLIADLGNATASDACDPIVGITSTDYYNDLPTGDGMQWLYFPPGASSGSCVSNSDCSNSTICFVLRYTPENTGVLTSYTTGFFVDCFNGNSPVTYNESCVMADNSGELEDCGVSGLILMNSSGNTGMLPVTAGVPVILHQVCFTLGAGGMVTLDEDETTDLTTSIDLPMGETTETPTFTNYVVDYDAFCGEGCLYPINIYRQFVATDDCGNIGSCIQTITIDDSTAPVITCPDPVSPIECPNTPVFGDATATDACDDMVEVTFDDVTIEGTCPQEYSITRTWTATDDCGNTATCSRTIVVEDNTPPVFGPIGMTGSVECPELPVFGDVTATDACDPVVEITFDDVTIEGTCTQEYSITRTWTAMDDCGNTSTAQQTINVMDNTAPTLVCPGDITFECAFEVPAPDVTSVTATDNCDPAPVVVFVSDVTISDECINRFTIVRTYSATDACDNTATCTQTITIYDDVSPMLTCPAGFTVDCEEDVPEPDITLVTATDNCLGVVTITHIEDLIEDPLCANQYTISRRYRATDECGNTADCLQFINVMDLIPPVITCPDDITVECASEVPVADVTTVTATDNCNAIPVITHLSDVTINEECANRFDIVRTYLATDDCGNTMTCTQVISVYDDTAPMITCPADVTVDCAADVPQPGPTTIPASDNCQGVVTVTHEGDVISNQLCENQYTVTRTYLATDECGNTATCTHQIIVSDNVGPVITCPDDVTIQCDESTDVQTQGMASATDNCDGLVTVTSDDVTIEGNCAQSYTIQRTWTATDVCGNTSTCLQTITLVDTEAPAITCPDDVTLDCNDSTDPFVFTFTDETEFLDLTGPLSLESFEGIAAPLFDNEIVVTDFTLVMLPDLASCGVYNFPIEGSHATDGVNFVLDQSDANGTATFTFNMPINSFGLNLTDWGDFGSGQLTFSNSAGDNFVVSVSPNVDGSEKFFGVVNSMMSFTQVVFTQTIDGEAFGIDEIYYGTINLMSGPTVTDNCDPAPVVDYADNIIEGSCANAYTIERTWTATDDCGNSNTCVQTLTVVDVTPPVIVCPADLTLECDQPTSPDATGVAMAGDNCDPQVTVVSDDVTIEGTCANQYTIQRTWTATDACGNTATCVQTLEIQDTTPPQISCPPNITLECDDSTDPSIMVITDETAFLDMLGPLTLESFESNPVAFVNVINTADFVLELAPPFAINGVYEIPLGGAHATDGVRYVYNQTDAGGTATFTFANPINTFGLNITDWGDFMNGALTFSNDAGDDFTISVTFLPDANEQFFGVKNASMNFTTVVLTQSSNGDNYGIDEIYYGLVTTPGGPAVSDNCDPSPVVEYVDVTIAGACDQSYTIERTWTATDECGNSASCLQVLTINDITAPLVVCPEDITVACGEDVPAPDVASVSATDNCDPAPVVTFVGDEILDQTCENRYTVERTYLVTDDCGNSTTCLQTIVVFDDIAPVITCPSDVTIECNTSTDPMATGAASALDNCTGDVVIPEIWINEIHYDNGGTDVGEFIEVAGPAGTDLSVYSIVLYNGSGGAVYDTDALTGSLPNQSNGFGTASISYPSNGIQNGPPDGIALVKNGTTVIQFLSYEGVMTAVGGPANGLMSTDIGVAEDGTEATGMSLRLTGTGNTYADFTWNTPATASQNALNQGQTITALGGPAIVFADVTAAGACPQAYTITRTWTATDDCGNTSTCDQIITITDSTVPDLTCAADITIECDEATTPDNTGMATATDNCDPEVIPTFSDVTAQGQCPQEYTITRTWTATDDCGNATNCIQIITVEDTTPPVITCAADVTIECDESISPDNTGMASATDNCDTEVIPTFEDVTIAGECPQSYTIQRTWTATDDCGNSSTCLQTIFIEDTTAPDLTCAADITIECDEATTPDNTGMATATDNCDIDVTPTFSDVTAQGQCPQEYTITRTWTSVDDCGNETTCTQIITVDDSTVPDLTCAADITIECDEATTPDNTGMATATDNCDPEVIPTFEDVTIEGECPQSYTIQRTWTATDDCGNATNCIQIITIEDSTVPDLTCAADITIECDEATTPDNTGMATATDNCDPEVIPTFSDVTAQGQCPQEYTITRTWTATDDCGNATNCIQIITVEDTTPPVMTCATDVTIECDESTSPDNTGMASATDNCDTEVIPTFEDVTIAGECPQSYTIQRTWTATDDCGNSSTCLQTIFVEDTTAPDLTCAADITIECDESTTPDNTGMAAATDNCDPDVILTFSDVTTQGQCPQEYTITRTWTAIDDCGNESTCTQIITVDDSTVPDLTCAADITIECDEATTPDNTGMATATDNCDPEVIPTFEDVTIEGECPQSYTIQRTWTATDDCGNSSTCLQTITVEDTTVPVLTCADDITIECDESTLPDNTGMSTAIDNCDPEVIPDYTDVTIEGSCDQAYTIERTWTATDDCGNATNCVQIITIVDTTPPAFTCAPNVTIECDESTLPDNTGLTSATDNCDPEPTVDYTDNIIANENCAANYLIERTWTITDNCGNGSTCLQLITVDDTTPPDLVCPDDVTLECFANTSPSNLPLVVTTYTSEDEFLSDAGSLMLESFETTPVSNPLDVIPTDFFTLTLAPSSDFNGVFNTEVGGAHATHGVNYVLTQNDNPSPVQTATFDFPMSINAFGMNVTDWGDFGTGTLTFMNDAGDMYVVDVSPNPNADEQFFGLINPDMDFNQVIFSHNITGEGYGIDEIYFGMASATGTATATDNCDPAPFVDYTDVVIPGDCPQEFVIERTWRATDDCLNMSTCVQIISVEDNLAPKFTVCPSDITIECDESTSPDDLGIASATDFCDAEVEVSQTDVTIEGPCPQSYTIERTWTATDDCGNTSTCLQIITIEDTTVPTITCPGDITIECDESTLPDNTGMASSTDNCDPAPVVTFDDNIFQSKECPQNYFISRIWTATDACGNTSQCSQFIVVEDTTPPVLTCADDITIECTESTSPDVTGLSTATDNCDTEVTPSFEDVTIEGQCPQEYTIIRTWTAEDDCGNVSTCEQTIFVDDSTPPAITCPDDVTFECAADVPQPNVEDITTSDNCGIPVVIHVSDVTIEQICLNQFTLERTYQSTDECGNTSTCVQIITVNDNTPPTIVCPGDVSFECADLIPEPNVEDVTVTDNCTGEPIVVHVEDITISQTCENQLTLNRVYMATDECGNTATCIQVITVFDDTAPVITCPDDVTFECADQVPMPDIADVTVSDNCNGEPTVTHIGDVTVSQTCANRFVLERTYMAVDECDNSATCVQTITVFDDTPPTITCPANLTVMCATEVPAPNIAGVTTSDNCSGVAPTVTFVSDVTVNQTCVNRYTLNRTYQSTDVCGNTATCVQVITVNDITPPTITCPAPLTVMCASEVPAPNINLVVASDNCTGPAPVVTFVSDVTVNQTCVNRYTLNRTYRATDACGNSATCLQVITVNDITPPSITCPAPITVMCAVEVPAPNIGSVTATDNCSGPAPVITFVSDVTVNQTCLNRYTLNRTYRATDACGNSATCVQVITVNDVTPPTIEFVDPLLEGVPNNGTIEVQCYGQDPNWTPPMFDQNSVEATDNCTGPVTVLYDETLIDEGDCAVDGYINRYRMRWTAIDACGNTTIATVFLNLVDTIPPVILGVPENITVNCDEVPEPPTLMAVDECLCACLIELVQEGPAPGCQDGQVIVRTWMATDDCGNVGTAQQFITLVDEEGPELTIVHPEIAGLPDGTVLEYTCNEGGIPEFFDDLNAEDVFSPAVCDGFPNISFDESIHSANRNCKLFHYIEQRIYTWTGIDDCGNKTELTLYVRLVDNEPPVIIGAPAVACIGDPALEEVWATDNCGDIGLAFWDVPIENPCGSGPAFRRTWEAVDPCGNYSRDTTILINDTQAPKIYFINPDLEGLGEGEFITTQCNDSEGYYTDWGLNDVAAEDECGDVTITFEEIIMERYDCSDGTVVWVNLLWTATDACGNSDSLILYVYIEDHEAPYLVDFDAEVSIGCGDELPELIADDNCSAVTITTEDKIIPGDCEFKYDVERTITVTDDCGNSMTAIQIVHVGDESGPIITGVIEEVCDDLSIPEVTAYDPCAQMEVPVMMEEEVLDSPCKDGQVIQRTWTAKDACGDVTTVIQYIYINDHTPPVIQVPTWSIILNFLDQEPNLVLLSQKKIMDRLNALGESSVYVVDDCDELIIPVFTLDVTYAADCEEDGYYERRVYTWTATDPCGNATVLTFTVDILDDVAPVLMGNFEDLVVICEQLPAPGTVTAKDYGTPVDIVYNQQIGPIGPDGEYKVVRTWTATDPCGNVAVATQVIFWTPDTQIACDIILPTLVPCNTHGVIIGSDVTGGIGPFIYEWEIVGEKCFIQSGQGTPEIDIYIGFGEVDIFLTVTDAFGCSTVCNATLDCLDPFDDAFVGTPIQVIPGQNGSEVLTPATPGSDYLSDLSYWPNPATASLNVRFESVKESEVEISFTNYLGQKVAIEKVDAIKGVNSKRIDVSNIQDGSYLLQVKTEKEVHTRTIVIMHNK